MESSGGSGGSLLGQAFNALARDPRDPRAQGGL